MSEPRRIWPRRSVLPARGAEIKKKSNQIKSNKKILNPARGMIIGSTSYFMRAKYRDFQKMENLTEFTLKTDLKFAFFFFP